MSKAYICDKCGLIVPAGGDMRTIYTVNPISFSVVPDECEINLCNECYGKFEQEYLENLRMES